jgi:hypothetical protein
MIILDSNVENLQRIILSYNTQLQQMRDSVSKTLDSNIKDVDLLKQKLIMKLLEE